MADETKYEGRFIRIVSRDGWEFADRVNCTGVVLVVALTDDNKIILVEQFRPPVGKNVIELPAGLVGDEDSKEGLIAAAIRELEEETGYRPRRDCDASLLVSYGPSTPGMASELLAIVGVGNLEKVGPGGGVGRENIVVHEVPRMTLYHWLNAKSRSDEVLVDLKVYSGVGALVMRAGTRW